MPRPIATLAHQNDARTSDCGQRSFCIIERLTAAAANPNGQMKVGQVSPTRKPSDFQRK